MQSANNRHIITLIVLTLIMLSSIALAQEESKNVPELFKSVGTQKSSPVNPPADRLALARRLMQQRDYINASAMLELILEQQPENPTIENLLLSCYISLRHHQKAELMARRLLIRHPTSIGFKMQLAEQLMLQEKTGEGLALYSEMVDSTKPGSHAQLDMILNSMIRYNLDEPAMAMIESTRADWNDPRLFATRRGTILEKQALWKDAAREYYSILDQDSTRESNQAEQRLMALLRFIDSGPVVEEELHSIVKAGNNHRVLRILISHYINQNQFDQAFELALHRDSLQQIELSNLSTREEAIELATEDSLSRTNQVGQINSKARPRVDQNRRQILMQFIFHCADQGQYSQVLRMCEYIRQVLPDSSMQRQIVTHYAHALTMTGRFNEAIAAYTEAAARFGDVTSRSDMLYQIGQIYMEQLHDYDRALLYFDSVVSHYRRGFGHLLAMQAIPLCHFRAGEYAKADLGFRSLSGRLMNDDDKERSGFYLALLSMTEKTYDSTEYYLQRMIINHPRGYYVNDAIELLSLLSQTESTDQLRDQIAGAVIHQYRLNPDSARSELLAVFNNPDQSLADVALYRLSSLELALNDSTAALFYAEELINKFDQSYFYPMALKSKADILLNREGGAVEAREIYLELLSKFATYPFVTEVRKVLRELDSDEEQDLRRAS